MYTARRKYILTFLEQNHEGSISDLAQKLNVSSMTIRRDIEFLAKQGLVTQIRGGVTLNHGAAFLHSQSLRKTLHINEKYRIAKYCAELIPEGSSIFIDCGSTTNQIAEEILQKKNITVLTNSLDVAQSLSTSKSLKVIMVPGVFSPLTRGFMGQFTSDFVKNFTIDFLFLGANGIDVTHGLSSPDYTDAETKKTFIHHSKKVIVAADHSKLDLNFFVRIAKLAEIDLIVTDKDADVQIIENYRVAGTTVVLV